MYKYITQDFNTKEERDIALRAHQNALASQEQTEESLIIPNHM